MGDDLDFFEWYASVDSYNRVENLNDHVFKYIMGCVILRVEEVKEEEKKWR